MQQLKKKQVNVCFLNSYSPYSWFGLNLRHMVMPHMYCEMQNKLSNTRGSPLGSMGEIISSRCLHFFKWMNFVAFEVNCPFLGML